MSLAKRGLYIAGMGIPSSGKTTMMRLLAEQSNGHFFAEPDEDSWPAAVLDRYLYGHFSAMTWFRSQRIPHYCAARQLADRGELAIVDSVFDVLMAEIIGRRGMEWLIANDDPYYAVSLEMARLDWRHLPEPDLMVFFHIERALWIKRLEGRGRSLDREDALLRSHPTQAVFLQASQLYAAEKGIPLLIFEQEERSPRAALEALTSAIDAHTLGTHEQRLAHPPGHRSIA